MLSETLSNGLERYRIGAKIRALRLGKQMGLAQLGKHSGLSSAMLSKIERSQLFPTLPTLLRIALVFGVGLEHFFTEETALPVTVVRKSERLRLPDRADAEPPSYLFESLDFPATDRKMDAFLATFPLRSEPSPPHRHEGAEFIYILDGELGLTISEGEEIRLSAGDTAYFDAGVLHSYRREGRSVCSAIVVVSTR
jgi:transcriptional regulator with XRE-family HTH domain